jgi:hypothetical protein
LPLAAVGEYTDHVSDLQLEKLQKDDEASAVAGAASANTAATLAELSQHLQLANLHVEAHSQEIDDLRGQLAVAHEEAAAAANRVDSVGRFLLQCMDDVRSKVVDLKDENTPEEDAKISVLPGAY